jgi:hypothetical protein
MIELILSCILCASPLAITANDSGLWFMGDVAPDKSAFSSRAKDLDFDLCQRYSSNEYVAVAPFTRRPSYLAVEADTLWFVDASAGVGLYSMKLENVKSTSTSKNLLVRMPILQSIYKTIEKPTGLVILEEQPVLIFDEPENNATTMVQFKDKDWVSLPSLPESGAKVAIFGSQLHAAVPTEGGTSLWYLQNGLWLSGDIVKFKGNLIDLLYRDNWPILVTSDAKDVTLTGIQQGGPVHLATLPLPKGRWGVAPTPEGLTVIGVQRKGIITSIDIGWPSGSVAEPIVLQERFKEDDSLLVSVLFVSLVLASLLLISKIRKPLQKK